MGSLPLNDFPSINAQSMYNLRSCMERLLNWSIQKGGVVFSISFNHSALKSVALLSVELKCLEKKLARS